MDTLHKSLCTVDQATQKSRGFLVVSRKIRRNLNRSKICSINLDRESVSRAATLLCQNFKLRHYNEFKKLRPSQQTPLEIKLDLLTSTLNDDAIRTILFTYLHEMTNMYSDETNPEVIDNYYLSVTFKNLIQEIRSLALFKHLEHHSLLLQESSLLKMIDFILPNLGLEILTLLLYACP